MFLSIVFLRPLGLRLESEAPDDSTSAPVESEAPDDSTSAPVESETPDDSTSAPVESETPDDSTSAPVESEAPDDSTSAPVESEAPDDSTSAPVESEAPDDSTSAPVESETPDDSTSAPVESEAPEESSEDESSVIVDMNAPMNPLPDTLETNPVDSYFNDSVFVGYSIMMHFGNYIAQWHSEIDSSIMGNPTFCAGVGISFYADETQDPNSRDSSLPLFRSKRYHFADLPTATGCNNLYIGLMGYSDLKRSGLNGAYYDTIEGIQRIRSANPNLNLVILACTYNCGIYSNSVPYSTLNNGKIREYNNMVLAYCTANGIDFVDVATPLTTYNGYLPVEYSSDESYHIAKKAFYIWVDVLRDYAERKLNGTWQNMSTMPILPAFDN